LKKLNGWGSTKIAKYGLDLLEFVNAFVASSGVTLRGAFVPPDEAEPAELHGLNESGALSDSGAGLGDDGGTSDFEDAPW